MKIVEWNLGRENARNMGCDKETVNRMRAITKSPRKIPSELQQDSLYMARYRFTTVVDARFYMGRSASASTVYCSVWIFTRNGEYMSGHSSAGGGGYHKESAALESALHDAGVKFDTYWGGSGDRAMEEALIAVSARAGFRAVGIL